jgi:hypothetical protein
MCQIVGTKHKPKAMGFDYCGNRRHYRTRRRKLSAEAMGRHERGQETKIQNPVQLTLSPNTSIGIVGTLGLHLWRQTQMQTSTWIAPKHCWWRSVECHIDSTHTIQLRLRRSETKPALCDRDGQQGMGEDRICRPRVTVGIAFPHATRCCAGGKLRFNLADSIRFCEKISEH